MTKRTPYTIGKLMDDPYTIELEIRPVGLTIEQFRADLPRLLAILEDGIVEANKDWPGGVPGQTT